MLPLMEPLDAALAAASRVASELARRVVQGLLEPLAWLADPAQRFFAPFLAGSLVLAVGVWAARVRRRGRTSLGAFLFARSVWLHRSALFDYRFVLVRAVVGALFVAPAVLSAEVLATRTALTLTRALGPSPFQAPSPAMAMAALSLAVFVAQDFARFVGHAACHRIPALWELHKVHHSAEVLTPVTLARTHPLEALWMRAASALALGLAAGAVAWLFRGRASAWELAGVDALGFVWTMLGANLRHSHVWWSFGPALEHVFVSPAQHQVHHSADPRHHGKNLGEALAVWDWLFGTLHVTSAREKLVFGLDESERAPAPRVVPMLVEPVVAAVRALVPTLAPTLAQRGAPNRAREGQRGVPRSPG